MNVLPLAEATSRLRTDRQLLAAQVADLTETELAAEYHTAAGPLGDGCGSLHDLVAHVLMWDEINLAVLTEAAAGRTHWSLDLRWAAPDAGRALNRGGVTAGRDLPGGLLRHRFTTVQAALLAEFGRYSEDDWAAGGHQPALAHGIGELAQQVWTVPGQPAFWHAAIHLHQRPQAGAAGAGPPLGCP